jgi:hypothetical protein
MYANRSQENLSDNIFRVRKSLLRIKLLGLFFDFMHIICGYSMRSQHFSTLSMSTDRVSYVPWKYILEVVNCGLGIGLFMIHWKLFVSADAPSLSSPLTAYFLE